jgi:hypothetical protein
MLHASSGARFAPKTLLGSCVANKSLTEHFNGYWSIDEQMRRSINGPHAAAAQTLVQTVLVVKHLADQTIDRRVGDRHIGLQRREIRRAHVHVVRISPSASRALEHEFDLESLNIISQQPKFRIPPDFREFLKSRLKGV